MAKTQWHPLFGDLLTLLLRDSYSVDLDPKVSKLPRAGDFLVVHKQPGTFSPFCDMWQYLKDWNVVEFKGMTDNAEVADLERLIAVGMGICVSLNEERAANEAIANNKMAFWYIAPSLSDDGPFIAEASAKSSTPVVFLPEGIWRATCWQHPIFLTSIKHLQKVPESLPLLLLNETVAGSLAPVLRSNPELAQRFEPWILNHRPTLWQEVYSVKVPQPVPPEELVKVPGVVERIVPLVTPQRYVELVGAEKVIGSLGADKIIGSLGADKIIGSLGADKIIGSLGNEETIAALKAHMTPEEWQAFLRRELQQSSPTDQGKP